MSRPVPSLEGFKYCSGCKEHLPLDCFGVNKNGSQGRRNKCKSCRNKNEKAYSQQNVARVSEWRKNNPEARKKEVLNNREQIRERRLKLYYGLSEEEYQELATEQNGVCAICGKPETRTLRGKIKPLCVDHDHNTGELRGLLCSKCNLGLVHFEDNIKLLRRAMEYLNEY